MKKLLFSLALFIGIVGIVESGGRLGQGWFVTYTTGSYNSVFSGKGFVKKIILSSGTSQNVGDFLIAFSTWNTPGATGDVMANRLFRTTAAITVPLMFQTTTTAANTGSPTLNNQWNTGDCDTCYVEIDGDSGLVIWQTTEGSGGANNAAVYWSR